MLAPDCPLVEYSTMYGDIINPPRLIQLHSLYQHQRGRPLVLLGESYTCPLYRYISHVLNDIYKRYQMKIST